jgi:UDP-N-acetylmuramoyl-L-alanyl-D-glutamate--2,6-diaminopimelate ligase
MERVEVKGIPDAEHSLLPLAVVDFAHTPSAVAAALNALRHSTPGSLVVVLGAGGDRDAGKRSAMGAAAAAHADLVIVTDDNPRSEDPAAVRAAVLGGALAQERPGPGSPARIREIGDRGAAIREAVAGAGMGDTVVVLGKGHESGQETAGVIHPFDDRAQLRAALMETHLGSTARDDDRGVAR